MKNTFDKKDLDQHPSSILPFDNTEIFENKILPKFVPTRVAAEYLQISENALRIKVHRGQIPVYYLGRNLRFKLSDLNNLISLKGDKYGN